MVALLFQCGCFRVGQLMTLQRLRATFQSDVISDVIISYPFIQVSDEHHQGIWF